MKNGDRITCEVIKLEHDQLTVKASYSKSSFVVDWREVKQVVSQQRFVVETPQGDYLSGTLKIPPEKPETVEIGTDGKPSELSKLDVVSVRQLGRGLLNRSAFTVDYGFSFTRSNTQTQSNLASTYNYFSEERMFSASINSLFASQQSASNTSRQQGDLNFYRRLRRSNTYAGLFGGFLSNNAQSLNLRATIGGGLSHRFRYTPKQNLTGMAGIVYTNEKYSPEGGKPGRFSAMEAALGASYQLLSFDSTELRSTFWVYPSLTDAGRVRASTDISVFLDLIGDLYWRIGFFNNFDSRPPLNTLRNDFGFTTSVGWKF